MMWFEMLQILTTQEKAERIPAELEETLWDIARKDGVEGVRVMGSQIYASNLMIVIVWNTMNRPEKTALGLHLANHLNEYGAVSHSIWTVQSTFSEFGEERNDSLSISSPARS